MRRRTVLLSGAAAAGALVVGWGLLPPRSRLGTASLAPLEGGAVALNGWIRIAADGAVQLAMPRSEMGQGIHTALAMLVAEELALPLEAVRLVEAAPERIYGNVAAFAGALPFAPRALEAATPRVRASEWIVGKLFREVGLNITGGSTTMADLFEPLRLAAATARAQLVGAASLAWRLPAAELVVAGGEITHASGQRSGFGPLAKAAAATPPGEVVPRARADWRLVGTAAPRTDVPAKVRGAAVFGLDVRPEGLVFASIVHAPWIGGSPGAVDASAALALPGVERLVRLPGYAGGAPALAVVGRSTWHARRGVQALKVDWQRPPAGAVSTAAIDAALEAAAREALAARAGFDFRREGDADAAFAGAPRVLESVYRAPYLAHATMEPINCTAQVRDGRVTLWLPTQAPGFARGLAAQVAGVPVERVDVHVMLLGGGFGRRLDVDFVGQAVRVAMETGGRPVQIVWPREEDIRHDFYRPAGVAVLRAALDADGRPRALVIGNAGDAPAARWMQRAVAQDQPAVAALVAAAGDTTLPRALQPLNAATLGPANTPDKTAAEGLLELPYAIPALRVTHAATRSGVPVGFWRAVGHSHNAFFAEGFVDELAFEAKADPVAFRLSLLDGLPRHAAVLKLAADKAGWGRPLPAGRARGVALHESFGSIVAEVVEASLVDGRPRVHRVVCAVDCGTVVNPGIVAQQIESGVIFGLSAALYGRIDIVDGAVQQSNFPDYRIVGLAESPVVETHLVASTRPPSGVGEPGLPPLAPALANALFVLTGRRWRSLPFSA
jgi:isoquinoline 1-oxidoreductase beta subunit